jgi:isopentenyl-diphosphate Delta-isomerase
MNPREMITGIRPDGALFPVDKLTAHYQNVRHKAVSVFLFCNGSLLLQRRAAGKYHSGSLWTNTCCSHPLWMETPAQCAHRRLLEEIRLPAELFEFGITSYAAPVGGDMFENEEVHLFAGHLHSRPAVISYDPREVCDVVWMDVATLQVKVAAEPERFTVWLRAYLQTHADRLCNEARMR